MSPKDAVIEFSCFLYYSSTIRVLRTWLERYFMEDFYDPPQYLLLKRLQELADEYRKTEGINISDFLTFIKTKIKGAEKRISRHIVESNSTIYNNLPRKKFTK